MSYTNSETVRRHLLTPAPTAERITDQAVMLPASTPVRFFTGAVDAATLRVKARRSAAPHRCAVTLTAGSVPLSAAPLVPGSVVVASDSSLGTVYLENVDFLIGYEEGTLTIKANGRLEAGSNVVVWFLPYTVCSPGDDYVLDASRGELRQRDGLIGVGERVYVDYTPLYLDLSDELIDGAVAAANGMVEREVDPDREFEADATLSGAATCRALELLSRAAATRELASLRGTDKVALAWLKLADDYAARAESLVRAFRAPLSGPHAPVHSGRRT